MTEDQIKAQYKQTHDTLSEDYYQNKLMSTDDFNFLHAQNWDDMTAALIAAGYILPPEPTPDQARLAEIVALSPQAITMPDMWEAIRILSRFHNIGGE